MKSVQAIRRFIANSWLVAAPLVVLFLLIVIPIIFAIVNAIVERVFGPEAAERLFNLGVDAMMYAIMLVEVTLALAAFGLVAYGMVRLTRRLVGKKEP